MAIVEGVQGRGRGSEWHRWDPHLHAPGTLLGDQFGNDWDGYLARMERTQPAVRALGVTDYACIRGYRRVREHMAQGRLPGVKLLFPNVEMRLTVETERRKGHQYPPAVRPRPPRRSCDSRGGP
jgi:hypothetical protein